MVSCSHTPDWCSSACGQALRLHAGSSPGDLRGLSAKRNEGSRRDVWGNPDSFLLHIVQGKRCFLPPQNPIGVI